MNGTVSSPSLSVERPSPDTLLIKLSGDIRGQSELLSIGAVRDVLNPATGARLLSFESAGVSSWDSRFVAFIRKCDELCRTWNVEFRDAGLPEGVRRLLRLAQAVPERTDARHVRQSPAFAKVG